MSATLEPTFEQALRAELVHRVQTSPRRRRWRWAIGGGLAIAVAAPAAAFAYDYLHPGVNEIELTAAVVQTGSGTARVDLGTPPDGATHVWMEVRCLSDGGFTFDDGAAVACVAGEHTSYSLALEPGTTTVGVTAADEFHWQVTAFYQQVVVEPFAVNENGDSYGAANDVYGEPDLIAVVATNGESGYVYATDLDDAYGPQPTSPAEAVEYSERMDGQTVLIPVYLSDGETRIGQFQVG